MNIVERGGVSPVHKDTVRLAEVAYGYHKERILDIGTGTGYVAIYLAQSGAQVDATDINQEALDCAQENAARNNVVVNIFYSDLFEGVQDTYDLIIFNPPIGGTEPAWQANIKAIIRKSIFKNLVSKIVSRMSQRKRLPFIQKFITEARKHVRSSGIILMHVQAVDMSHLALLGARPLEKVFEHTLLAEISIH